MSIIAAGTTTTTALSSTGNTDGTIQLQVNGTTPSVTLNALGAVGVGASPNFGTSGQALVSAGSTAAPTWTTIAASQWTTSGSNISYTAGQVQISTGSAAAPALSVASDTNTGVFFPAADTIAFAEGGVESMRLDSSGNLGLGVVPSAWGTQRALDFAYGGLSIGTGLGVELVGNTFWNGANWIYKGNGPAFRYEQDSAGHKWYNAPSGTAGNAITFTQQFAINNSGAIGVGSGNSTGTSGQVLTSAGSGAAPTWATPAGGSWVFLTSVTASNSATIDIDSNLTTTYKQYAIVVSNFRPVSSGVSLLLRQRTSGTYQTTGYNFFLDRSNSGSGVVSSRSTNSDAIYLLENQNGTAQNTGLVIYVNNPAYTPASPNTTAQMVYWMGASSGGNIAVAQGAGGLESATVAVTGYRFLTTSGNIATGTFSLYGIANS